MKTAIDHVARTNGEVMKARNLGDLGWILQAPAPTRSLALSFLADFRQLGASITPAAEQLTT